MKNKRKVIQFIIKISLILIAVSFIKTEFLSWGQIEIIVYNNTFLDQTVWLSPKNKYTYDIRADKKEVIKYRVADDISIDLILNYYNKDGISEEIVLSEYVENHEKGKVIVEMNQLEENGEIVLEITNKIK